MEFHLSNQKSIVSLSSPEKELLSLYSSRKIEDAKLALATLDSFTSWSTAARERVQIKKLKGGWKISRLGEAGWSNWWMKVSPSAIILPTREGEYISNPKKLAKYHTYNLSYPGTASTKCVIVFINTNCGFLIGSKPSLSWGKISLARIGEEKYILKFLQKNQDVYLYPFNTSWEAAVDKFKARFPKPIKTVSHNILKKPRFLLQMGARDFLGKAFINKFSDLTTFVNLFHQNFGEGHLIHLFGTNSGGFDRMFPDFSIDPKLGGKRALSYLVDKIHHLGLYTSHHFNPRIADIHWLEKHPKFKEAIVNHPSGTPWIEFYKNNIYFVMNPSHQGWQEYCIKTIGYFKEIGFDYIELDQIAYQRNLFTPDEGFGNGYQELINLTAKEGIKYWVEGVSDIYQLHSDCFFQVLPRDKVEFWETDENRRGYPYGTAFTSFYRRLMPHVPVSFQIVTEKCKVNLIPKRFRIAKKIKAKVYDLEMGFVDKTYHERLKRTLKHLNISLQNT